MHTICRSSFLHMFFKIGALEFSATLFKKRLWRRYFPANFLEQLLYRTRMVAASELKQ